MKPNLFLARSARALTDPIPSDPKAGRASSIPVFGNVPDVLASLLALANFLGVGVVLELETAAAADVAELLLELPDPPDAEDELPDEDPAAAEP